MKKETQVNANKIFSLRVQKTQHFCPCKSFGKSIWNPSLMLILSVEVR